MALPAFLKDAALGVLTISAPRALITDTCRDVGTY